MFAYADTTWFKSPSGATNGGSQVTAAGSVQNPGYSSDMLGWKSAEQTLLRSGTHALISSGVSTAINGGSFSSNLANAALGEAVDLGAAAGNKAIGDLAHGLGVNAALAEKLVLHAALGGLISKAKGEDFASGAIAGGIAEGLTPIANALLADFVSSRFDSADLSDQGSQYKIATGQIIGLIAAGMAGGNPATGSLIGGSAEKYNDQGWHGDPTNLFDDNGLPPQDSPTALDNLKAQVSLFILFGLMPGLRGLRGLFGGSSEGLLAETAMLSEAENGLGAATTGAGRVSGGAKVTGVGGDAAETEAAANGGVKEAGSSATKLSQGEQKAVVRIDKILKNFKDHDIEGTLKDMAGDPVPRKNGSGYYDHLNEMQERIRGLTNHAETLKNVSNPEAQAARQAALDTLKRISDSLNGAGI